MAGLTRSPAWRALREHASRDAVERGGRGLRELFAADPQRAERFCASAAGIHLDYAKNLICTRTLQLLLALARQQDVEGWREALFSGRIVNPSENRPALHTALRQRADTPLLVDGEDVIAEIRSVQRRMRFLVNAVRSGAFRGCSGEPIRDIVNIGVGGSDLGPLMACAALYPYADQRLRVHFVSNIDLGHLASVFDVIEPQNTLFIVASKSFTTAETMHNARAAREWFLARMDADDADLSRHFIAVTARADLARSFGIEEDKVFEFWDWVGGRYSLWSAIGLPLAFYLGIDHFDALLDGADAMDRHFREAPLAANLPVLLGLLGVWYNNFLGARQHLLLPYNYALRHLPSYLQQLEMESNGKSVDRCGAPLDYPTAPTVWGGPGCNAQHAYYQLIHQGSHLLPSDLIIAGERAGAISGNHPGANPGSESDYRYQPLLAANFIAQSEALLRGRQRDADGQPLPGYRQMPGERPSNAIVLERLDPAGLGALLAMYEHKVFVQSVIWEINPFDQWGVELGKQLADELLPALYRGEPGEQRDGSTASLIQRLRVRRAD